MSSRMSSRLGPLGLVGPLPPPSGGMGVQCEQLLQRLRAAGVDAHLLRSNAPYRPAWAGRLPVLRALARLLPYLWQAWRLCGRVRLLHVMANSGWAWHLFVLPVLLMARWRGVPVIINYHGGLADQFLSQGPAHVRRMLGWAALRVTPSVFLQRVFAAHGLSAEVVPNGIDLGRFSPGPPRDFGDAPHLLVARNLEPVYDNATALRAFALVRERFKNARLTIAGSGPERERLQALAAELGLQGAVAFAGRVENARMGALYAQADCMLNPSTVDNAPISILEAFASGLPVVSTDVGGIPDMVQHELNGLLVPAFDAERMAAAAIRMLADAGLAGRLREAGLLTARACAWEPVTAQWLTTYQRVLDAQERPT
jgi:glycosyltransferase involved in cell wall biosynthesis